MLFRSWYDLAWYAGSHPEYNLAHLENRARQSGDYTDRKPLIGQEVHSLLSKRLQQLDIEAIKADVRPFLRDQRELEIWSRNFFEDVFRRLVPIWKPGI